MDGKLIDCFGLSTLDTASLVHISSDWDYGEVLFNRQVSNANKYNRGSYFPRSSHSILRKVDVLIKTYSVDY